MGCVTLNQIALEFLAQIDLRLGFDAFGDHLKPQIVRHPGQMGHHDSTARVVFDIPDQASIQLQDIQWQLHDLGERGVAGAKIVQGDAQTHFLEFSQQGVRQALVVKNRTFGYFEFEPSK